MYAYRDKVALITGASSGIGEAFARALARRRMQIILTARSEEKLRLLAAELTAAHRIRVEVVVADLAREGGAQMLVEAVSRLEMPVDLLVNNAAFASYGSFDRVAPDSDRRQVQLNVAAVTDLTHAFLPGMLERGSGAILTIASVVAFFPMPYQSVYGAGKAYVLSLSRALAAEYRGRGVRLLAVCPGGTDTNFSAAAGAPSRAAGSRRRFPMRTPDQVVMTAIRGLESGRSVVVDGLGNRVLVWLLHLLPPALVARAMARILRPAAD